MLSTAASLHFTNPSGFIVLEGVNGSGKSTLQKRLQELISRAGKSVVSTFEPGATAQGKALRQLLLNDSSPRLTPLSELLLFVADRHEHVTQIIRPALSARQIVLCDRYFYSTIAFQGYGRGLDRPTIDALNALAVQDTLPDLVLLLDLDPKVGLSRTIERRNAAKNKDTSHHSDSFESEALAFHTRLRNGFLELARQRPEPFLVLDAAQSADKVFEEASRAISALINSHT